MIGYDSSGIVVIAEDGNLYFEWVEFDIVQAGSAKEELCPFPEPDRTKTFVAPDHHLPRLYLYRDTVV